MFAINHAAAALLVKRRYPDVSLGRILIAVQSMELLWLVLNYTGIERTTTKPVVRYVGDIHLTYMPLSHSVTTILGAAVLAWSIGTIAGRPRLGAALRSAWHRTLCWTLLRIIGTSHWYRSCAEQNTVRNCTACFLWEHSS